MSIIKTPMPKTRSRLLQIRVMSDVLRKIKTCAIEQNTTLTELSHRAWLDYLEKYKRSKE